MTLQRGEHVPTARGPSQNTPEKPLKRRSVGASVLRFGGFAPFGVFVTIFLIVPVAINLWTTFRRNGSFTLEPFLSLFHSQYVSAFYSTARLSVLATIVAIVGGTILAWALVTTQRPRWLQKLAYSLSIVAARSGGVPIAFAYIATIGTHGLITRVVSRGTGWNLSSVVHLDSVFGLLLVYTYFQLPLMTVLVLPSFYGLRRQWKDAAASVGASAARYLRDIALPILWPSILASAIVVFADSFQAYATAYALAGSGANLVPILIGSLIQGNVYTDESLGAALVTGMMIIIFGAMMFRYWVLRRTARWMQ